MNRSRPPETVRPESIMRPKRSLRAVFASLLLVASLLSNAAPASAHGSFIDLRANVWCERYNGFIRVTWQTPAIYTAPNNQWSYVAYGIYGEAGDILSPTIGWTGYINWGGAGGIWNAAWGNGYRGQYNWGSGQYQESFAADVPFDTFSTADNYWYVGMTVWWPDGHKEFFWLQSPYIEAC